MLYKLEWGSSYLFVGARSIPEAIRASKERGYTSEPLRAITYDNDLVVADTRSAGEGESVSAIDDYKNAKETLHTLRHRAVGSLRVRIERRRIQPSDFDVTETIIVDESNPLHPAVFDLLGAYLNQLRDDAEKEAREMLEEPRP